MDWTKVSDYLSVEAHKCAKDAKQKAVDGDYNEARTLLLASDIYMTFALALIKGLQTD